MSAKNKAHVFWIFPAALLASWVAVRGLAASPTTIAAAMPAATSSEVADASLRKLIGDFADAARGQR
jgi:hypothetical protein